MSPDMDRVILDIEVSTDAFTKLSQEAQVAIEAMLVLQAWQAHRARRTTKAQRRAAKARKLHQRRSVRAAAAARGASPALACQVPLLRASSPRTGTGRRLHQSVDGMPVPLRHTARGRRRPGAKPYVVRNVPTNQIARDHRDWGTGPWQHEDDWATWTTEAGYTGLMLRNQHTGTWLGYVVLPPGHPLHGQPTDAAYHALPGGDYSEITYADHANPSQGYPVAYGAAQPWLLGFDTGHVWDYTPGLEPIRRITLRTQGHPYDHEAALAFEEGMDNPVYRTQAAVRDMVEALAQAAAMREPGADARPAPPTRAQHLAWVRQRALAALDNDPDLDRMMERLEADIAMHPATENDPGIAALLAGDLAAAVMTYDRAAVRRMIEEMTA